MYNKTNWKWLILAIEKLKKPTKLQTKVNLEVEYLLDVKHVLFTGNRIERSKTFYVIPRYKSDFLGCESLNKG